MTTKVIHKQQLGLQDYVTLLMPKDAKILKVDSQHGIPCIWYEADVSNTKELEERHFFTYNTDHEFDNEPNHDYIGTYMFQNGDYVYHVYEVYT